MKKYLISITILSAVVINCKTKESTCQAKDFKEIDLKPSRVKFNIPSSCQLKDSTIYDNVYKNFLLNYAFSSSDSSLFITADIQSDKMHKDHFTYQNFYSLNREEVNNWPDSKNTLLKDFSRNIDTVKVGYLKYLIKQKDNDHYEGRIFFLREGKIIKLWVVEKIDKNKDKDHLLMDCVFESIKLY